ncbi:unnamed protein product, partial [Closterium sp. NIES-53]
MPDQVSYATVMHALGRAGRPGDAVRLFERMRATGWRPDAVTYATIITSSPRFTPLVPSFSPHARRADQHDLVLKWLEQMAESECMPDQVSYATVMHALGRAGRPGDAVRLFERMRATGWRPDAVTYATIITAFGEAGGPQEAYDLWKEMKRVDEGMGVRGAGVWKRGGEEEGVGVGGEGVVSGREKSGLSSEAVKEAAEEAAVEGETKAAAPGAGAAVPASATTAPPASPVAAAAAAPAAAAPAFARLQDAHVPVTTEAVTIMMALYTEKGEVDKALALAEEMREVYLAGEGAYNEDGSRAYNEDGKAAGTGRSARDGPFRPDATFYSVILQACRECGLVEEARRAYAGMKRDGVVLTENSVRQLAGLFAEKGGRGGEGGEAGNAGSAVAGTPVVGTAVAGMAVAGLAGMDPAVAEVEALLADARAAGIYLGGRSSSGVRSRGPGSDEYLGLGVDLSGLSAVPTTKAPAVPSASESPSEVLSTTPTSAAAATTSATAAAPPAAEAEAEAAAAEVSEARTGVAVYTAIIHGFGKGGRFDLSALYFKKMLAAGIEPDTYVAIVFLDLLGFTSPKNILEAPEKDFDKETSTESVMIDAPVRARQGMVAARKLLLGCLKEVDPHIHELVVVGLGEALETEVDVEEGGSGAVEEGKAVAGAAAGSVAAAAGGAADDTQSAAKSPATEQTTDPTTLFTTLLDRTVAGVHRRDQKPLCNNLLSLLFLFNRRELSVAVLKAMVSTRQIARLFSRDWPHWTLHLSGLSYHGAQVALRYWLELVAGAVEAGKRLPREMEIEVGVGRSRKRHLRGAVVPELARLGSPFQSDEDRPRLVVAKGAEVAAWVKKTPELWSGRSGGGGKGGRSGGGGKGVGGSGSGDGEEGRVVRGRWERSEGEGLKKASLGVDGKESHSKGVDSNEAEGRVSADLTAAEAVAVVGSLKNEEKEGVRSVNDEGEKELESGLACSSAAAAAAAAALPGTSAAGAAAGSTADGIDSDDTVHSTGSFGSGGSDATPIAAGKSGSVGEEENAEPIGE